MSVSEMRKIITLMEASVKNVGKDMNGLEFSSQSGSGYKFVTTLLNGPLKGKFIAYAKVSDPDMQEMNIETGSNKRIPGFFGHKDTVGLAVFDDVRDAAYVGQKFNSENPQERHNNLLELFSGNESVVPKSPGKWQYDPDWEQMNAAKEKMMGVAQSRAATREKNKVTLDVQKALGLYYQQHKDEYDVNPAQDATKIRNAMNVIIARVKKPTDQDFMDAAQAAFAPYKK